MNLMVLGNNMLLESDKNSLNQVLDIHRHHLALDRNNYLVLHMYLWVMYTRSRVCSKETHKSHQACNKKENSNLGSNSFELRMACNSSGSCNCYLLEGCNMM